MTELLRVLLVEDSDSDAKLVTHALRATGRELRIERIQEAGAMRDALARLKFDVVISDWSLPQFSAPAALTVLQTSGVDLPFIIVSGTVGEETAIEAMRAGAHDYVLKDKLARLAPAVERELREHAARDARRHAEEALHSQAARFRALIEHSDDGIVLCDRDARVIYASPGAMRIVGGDSPIGELVIQRVHPDDVAKIMRCSVRLRLAPGSSETLEYRIRRSDGAMRWIESTLVNRLDEPAVAAVTGNIRDITERKLALDELRESELRFRRLWESGLVGIAIADDTGGYLEANDTLLAMLGCTRADLGDGSVPRNEATPAPWRHSMDSAVAQLKLHGHAKPQEREYVRKDGSLVPVLVGIAPLTGTRAISLVVDLSERKRAELALRESEVQFRQAQKMEAVGRLAGGIAHDFNNLLSMILSYGDLMSEDMAKADPLRADLDEIRRAAQRAAQLTLQLLMFSRRQFVEVKVIDLNALLASMNNMLSRMLGEDVELVSRGAELLGHVKVDPGSIEQVVMNLAVNARDAMPTGGKLTIETSNVELPAPYARAHALPPGSYVMLTVSDSGIGMDEETCTRVFEPFFTTKEMGRGTGLGLSTVFGIVQQSGGSLRVDSELGHGTSFEIYLPRVDAPLEPIAPAASEILRGTETVLLVEDEDALRAAAQAILTRSGYTVLPACDGKTALAISEDHPGTIHLLLTDVVMPRMSGPELAKQLVPTRPGMKVLYVSGYTDDSVLRHGILEASVAFLQKPITPETLTRKVRAVLDDGAAS